MGIYLFIVQYCSIMLYIAPKVELGSVRFIEMKARMQPI